MKLVLYTLLLCITYFFPLQSSSGDNSLIITEVQQTDIDTYSITFNDIIEIREIKVQKNNGNTKLQFPEYVSKKGKIFPQVKILSKKLENKIIYSIISGKKEKINFLQEPKFKINKFSEFRRSGSNIKFFVTIVFNDELEIECKILDNSTEVWVAWPGKKEHFTKKWVPQVVFKSSKFKNKVEQEVLNKYETFKVETGQYRGKIW